MAASTRVDRRLREREIRKGNVAPAQFDADDQELPDLAENAEFPSDERVERLVDELEAEKVARDLRVERALSQPARSPVHLIPLTPLDIE